jgi:hypothetical protein
MNVLSSREWTSPLLQPLSPEEETLLGTIAGPLSRHTHAWPTWDYVDLTYRKNTNAEAAPIAAGLPWLYLKGATAPYRLLWFSEPVNPGTAPGDPATRVGLTVAGMCHLATSSSRPFSPFDHLTTIYVLVLHQAYNWLRQTIPDPDGVVEKGIPFGVTAEDLRQLAIWGPTVDIHQLLKDLVMREPATWVSSRGPGDLRIEARMSLVQFADCRTAPEYVETLSSLRIQTETSSSAPRGPLDLTDALGRLALAMQVVTRRHLWERYPIDYAARLSVEPHSGPEYRDHLVALTALFESMRVPKDQKLDPKVKALKHLEAFLKSRTDQDREPDIVSAIQILLDITALRNGFGHYNDNAASAAQAATRRLGLPPLIDDYPAAFDTIARAIITACRTLSDLLVEVAESERKTEGG